MAENSKIEWTTHTFNPWRGCTKIAAGCANCYADSQAKRNPSTLGIWGDNGTRVVASEAMWREPIKWNKAAEKAGERHRVFCASMADVFEDWQGQCKTSNGMWANVRREWGVEKDYGGVPLREGNDAVYLTDVRRRLFALIDATPNLDWLLLTKRPENIKRMWPPYFPGGYLAEAGSMNQEGSRPNVWLGTSIATQADADRNIPELLKCRDLATVLFVSAEPLLGKVDIVPFLGGNSYRCKKCGDWKRTENEMAYVGGGHYVCVECGTSCPPGPTIDWLIAGGESGHNARPMHPDWARSLRDQCQAADVPFFFKQWGEYCPFDNRIHGLENDHADTKICRLDSSGREITELSGLWDENDTIIYRVGKSFAGRLLDGREWNEFPKVNQ